LSGFAEIFGTELAPGPLYSFTGRKLAVFTWQGCELEITGTPSSCYVAEETPMSTYLNVHIALEQIREKCDESGESGPRVSHFSYNLFLDFFISYWISMILQLNDWISCKHSY